MDKKYDFSRILVVDDNQVLVANILTFFEPHGFIMDTAPDGPVGLHMAITNNLTRLS